MNFDIELGNFNSAGWNYNHVEFQKLVTLAEREQQMFKALTTGNNVVLPGQDASGSNLRRQFLFGDLAQTAQAQDDLKLIKLCKTKSYKNVLLEWTTQGELSGGDGFVSETGSSSNFGVDFNDEQFQRQSETVKFLAEGRSVSIAAQEVDSIIDPMVAVRDGLKRALLTKANLAGYFGDASKSATQFNGIIAQLRSWCDLHPEDYGLQFDCQGLPIDKYMLQRACIQNRNRFGKIDLLLQSTLAYGDSTTTLWPEARTHEGQGGQFGQQFRRFIGPAGDVAIEDDPALRPGQPGRISGPGSDGLPRTLGTLDPTSITFSGNPFVGATVTTPAPGTGNFWTNFTKNTDSVALAILPAVPTGSNDSMGGGNRNELAAGTYYYAAALVYKGFEGPAWVLGAGVQTNSTIAGTPTGIAIAAGRVAQIDIDVTQIPYLGQNYERNLIKVRVYRAGGPNAAAPTRLSDYKFLMETGLPTGGNTRAVDNGMSIPGMDNAFGITTRDNGWAFAELLPLMQRMLPKAAMADLFCILWFATILLRVRKHHIHFRNVGPAN